MKLNCEQVVFHSLSYADQNCRVFWWEGELYRAITSERAAFYHRLLSEGFIQDLARRNLIIDTDPTELELEGYALVLKHRTVPFVSYCYEWCGEMLKVAALSVLRLEEALLTYGLTLRDPPHPWNVLFVGPTPVWVDLGALGPVCRGEPWGYERFSAFFTRPLEITAAGHGHIARSLLRHEFRGVEPLEVEAITATVSAKASRNVRMGARTVARKIIPPRLRPFLRRAVKDMMGPGGPFAAAWEPMASVEKAVRDIEAIRFVEPSAGWLAYYSANFPDFTPSVDWTEKQRSIFKILHAKKPRSVLDIGSNRGWYSQLAARNGAQVVSIDADEPSINKLFDDAVADGLPILPLLMDFRALNPAMVSNYPPGLAPATRLRCDMVLALALVHHLVFTLDMKFEEIVCALSVVTRKWLVVEFVGRDDRSAQHIMNKGHSWYSIDNFLNVLAKEFREIKILSSDDEHRRILLCNR